MPPPGLWMGAKLNLQTAGFTPLQSDESNKIKQQQQQQQQQQQLHQEENHATDSRAHVQT